MAHEWQDRVHFYNVASGIMRHVLVDHARGLLATKRGAGAEKRELDESVFPSVRSDEDGLRDAERTVKNAWARARDRLATILTA